MRKDVKINVVVDNYEKKETYSSLNKKCKMYLENNSYESVLLLSYAMIEDRLLSMLHYFYLIEDKNKCLYPSDYIDGYIRPLLKFKENSKKEEVYKIYNISTKVKLLKLFINNNNNEDNVYINNCYNVIVNKIGEDNYIKYFDDLEDFLKVRNEIIHSSFNKNINDLNIKLELCAKEGYRLSKLISKYVNLIKYDTDLLLVRDKWIYIEKSLIKYNFNNFDENADYLFNILKKELVNGFDSYDSYLCEFFIDNCLDKRKDKNESECYFYLLKDKLLKNRNWFKKLFAHYLCFDLDINYYKDIVLCFNMFDKEILKSRDIYKEIYNEEYGLSPGMLFLKIFSNEYFNCNIDVFDIVRCFFENISDEFYYLDKNSTKEEIIDIIKDEPISIFNINEDLRLDRDILLTLLNLCDEDGLIKLVVSLYVWFYGNDNLLNDRDIKDALKRLGCIVYSLEEDKYIGLWSGYDG